MSTLTQFNESNQTMSSREMAEIVRKPHDNVLKLIRSLIKEGVVKNTIPQSYIHEQNKQTYEEYISDKRDSLVIVGRLDAEFMAAVFDRWQELEAKNYTVQLPDFTDPAEAAIAWAAEFKAKQVIQKQLDIAKPKISYYDTIVDRNNLLNASQVSQKIKMSAVKLNRILDDLKVYNNAVKSSRVFQQWFVDKGYGLVRQTDQGYPQAMFTLSGEAWVIEKLISEGVIA